MHTSARFVAGTCARHAANQFEDNTDRLSPEPTGADVSSGTALDPR